MKYLDVLVVISPARGGDFEVNVASDAGGEGNSVLKLPFAMRDLSGVMFNVQGDARKFLAAEPTAAVPAGTASTFGVKLFEALFQGETREVLSRTESEAKRLPDTGVRIRLSMNLAAEGMAEVASLPWELMRRRDQSPLVVSVQTPVVRAFDTPKPVVLQPLSGKLRILALVSNPKGTAALNLKDEVERISKIWATLDNVEVDFVRPVEDEILSHLARNQYHVIHYMGHGDFDSGAGGLLMMERDDGSAHLISGDTFAAWLADEPLRLVFLNACNTGTTGEHLGLHPFAGVASALIRSGVPSVVAMQFPISDKAAIIFAQTFYERIAQSFPVDAAVGDGRKRLLTSDGAEWATPVLYMRAADGHLFDLAKPGVTPRKRVAKAAAAASGAERTEAQPVQVAVAPAPAPPVSPAPALPAAAFVAESTAAPPAPPPEPRRTLVGDVVPPAKPWFKRPLGLASIAVTLIFLLLIIAGGFETETTTTETTTTETTTTEETAADAMAPAAEAENPAIAAIAALPADIWITDPDPEKTVNAVLATVPIDQLRALADAGDAKAAYLYGNAVWYGRGDLAPSKASAVPWFRVAAEQGLAVAEYSMASFYRSGVDSDASTDGTTIPGVAINEAEAQVWLEKARAQGNTDEY